MWGNKNYYVIGLTGGSGFGSEAPKLEKFDDFYQNHSIVKFKESSKI